MSLAADTSAAARADRDLATERLDFAVDGATCAACMRKIERSARTLPGVVGARYNFTTHRLAVDAAPATFDPIALIERLDGIGYEARPYRPDVSEARAEANDRRLLRALAVAGFGAANIMLLSVSVWSGNVSGIAPETRDLFHWISALIALPVVAYAGQPFFESAATALRAKRLNMDVPISLAVLLALVMSVIQTASGADHAYFDSAVMLLFFLLIGRVLDSRARRQTRDLGQNLLALQRPTVTKLLSNGETRQIASADVMIGDRIVIAAGSRIGVDGCVVSGSSAVDASLITGESAPRTVRIGDDVFAGTLNLSGSLTVEAQAAGANTLLSEISDLMERATAARGRYRRLADRAASIYAPLVHILAALTFIGWLALGFGWQLALLNAIAVLIITCPCALGLAVPTVQAVATGSLFRAGALVNSGDALERLAQADMVVFDKTGTLTEPDPDIQDKSEIPDDTLALAARLAMSSHHALAKALARYAKNSQPFQNVREIAGKGVSAITEGRELRLGSRAFCGVGTGSRPDNCAQLELWFRDGGKPPVAIRFGQSLKRDALESVSELKGLGLGIKMISGDREAPVRSAAKALGISEWEAATDPKQKIARIEDLQAAGKHVLMVGDGLNDAAALQTANVSAAPAAALDITQAAADVVMIGNRLTPLVGAVKMGRKARALMLQNFAFAAAYNLIAIPLAVVGLVTPLMAALFMSGSSLLVTLNALRAKRAG